jgi:hypothetical protein
MANLIAAILVTSDVAPLPEEKQAGAMNKWLDLRRTQVMEMAREHYKVYPIDFEQAEVREDGGVNNLAKLNRANLTNSLP